CAKKITILPYLASFHCIEGYRYI
ncbi:unnamed protein product, partial [Allacma fusca]